jgi:Response regulators consisting of a CheY-like receiver domain and a winged-helix DNA-binding domain
MAVDVVYDGERALESSTVVDYDVVVLDRDLPGIHGDEVCSALAAQPLQPRVLMLTASGTMAERVEGLNLGADDYLPKPFGYPELIARIRAISRRQLQALPPVLVHDDLRLDPSQRIATRGGERLPLNPKELAVLEYLLVAQGRPVPSEELLERVWDEATDPFTNTVKTTINRLRSKLGSPPLIATIPRSGYRI